MATSSVPVNEAKWEIPAQTPPAISIFASVKDNSRPLGAINLIPETSLFLKSRVPDVQR